MTQLALALARVDNWARQQATTEPKIQYARLLVREVPTAAWRTLAQRALGRLEGLPHE